MHESFCWFILIISEVIICSTQKEKRPIYSTRKELVFQAYSTQSECWPRISISHKMSQSCTEISLNIWPRGENTNMEVSHQYQAELRLLTKLATCCTWFTLGDLERESGIGIPQNSAETTQRRAAMKRRKRRQVLTLCCIVRHTVLWEAGGKHIERKKKKIILCIVGQHRSKACSAGWFSTHPQPSVR